MSSQYNINLTKFNLKFGKTVSVKSGFRDNYTDNVLITCDNIDILPSISRLYLYKTAFLSGYDTYVQHVDKNLELKSTPLVDFIREFLALIRTFKIPKIHQEFQISRTLSFCLVSPKLMKKSDRGCMICVPFTSARAFFKAENDITSMLNDIFTCVFNKTYNNEIMFGESRADLSELGRACYEAVNLPLPTK